MAHDPSLYKPSSWRFRLSWNFPGSFPDSLRIAPASKTRGLHVGSWSYKRDGCPRPGKLNDSLAPLLAICAVSQTRGPLVVGVPILGKHGPLCQPPKPTNFGKHGQLFPPPPPQI